MIQLNRLHRVALCSFAALSFQCLQAEPISFGAMGCGPYYKSDVIAVRHYLKQENAERSTDFLVHVGDLFTIKPRMSAEAAAPAASAPTAPPAPPKSPDATPASDPPKGETLYEDFAQLLTDGNSIPTFILPGDNEWNDTAKPELARTWWEKHLLKFEERQKPAWVVRRQAEHAENFAFVRKGVVFVGLNVVGGRIHDASEWKQRLTDNAKWLRSALTAPEALTCRAAVILSQANPMMISKAEPQDKYDAFILPMREAAAAWGKPVLYLHADGHKWIDDQPWPEKNIRRIQLERWEKRFPTTKITISDEPVEGSIFQADRRLRQEAWKVHAAQ